MNNRKIVKKVLKTGQRSPCLSQVVNICCKHILPTKKFRSATTGETFDIKHRVNCNCNYLASCKLCPAYQYVGKFETTWGGRLYDHRKDAKKTKSIPYDERFSQPNHNFSNHAKFIIIDSLENQVNTSVDRRRIEDQEDYYVTRLQTSAPKGFNDRWNSPIRTKVQKICT